MAKKKKEEEIIITEYDFVINKKAKTTIHRNEYEIEVENMHGDADHYSTRHAFFKREDENEDSMKKLYMWLSFFDHLKVSGREETEEILNKYIEAYLKDIGEDIEDSDYSWDITRELVDWDATTDNQYMCRPKLVAVYYHDTYGVKQEVKFKKK